MRNWLDDVPDPEEQELEGPVAPFHDALVPGIRLLNERMLATIAQLERRQASPDALYERDQIRAHFGNEVQAGDANRPLDEDPCRCPALLRDQEWQAEQGPMGRDEGELAPEIEALRER